MNLYIRYFNDEAVVASADEAYQFLCEVTKEVMDVKHLEQLRDYMESPMTFTKKFKVRNRVYYIGIKTDVSTLEEFKERGRQLAEERADKATVKEQRKSALAEERPGWYEGSIVFKRVVFNVATGKNEYVETPFAARLKAQSIEHAYNRICEHILSRPDVDPRSQMPSVKGKNFKCVFLGENADLENRV